MAYCNRCGKEIEEGDAFCHACGSPLGAGGETGFASPQEESAPPPGYTGVAAVLPAATQGYSGKQVEASALETAERRVRQKMELWWHLGSYLIVNTFLVIVWAAAGAGYPWFIWVTIGWGIGVAFHLMHYLMNVRGGPRRERMIRKEMERLRRKQGGEETPGEGGQPGGPAAP